MASKYQECVMAIGAIGAIGAPLVLAVSCARAEPGRLGTPEGDEPQVVRAVTKPECDRQWLETFQPPLGRIVQRRVGTERLQMREVAGTERVVCGHMLAGPCLDWARAHAQRQVVDTELEPEVMFPVRKRGVVWKIRTPSGERALQAGSAGELLEAVRAVEAREGEVVNVSYGNVTKLDLSEVVIRYLRPPAPTEVPSARWIFETAADARTVAELPVAALDLAEQATITPESIDRASDRLVSALGEPPTPTSGALPPRDRSAPVVRLELDVHCGGGRPTPNATPSLNPVSAR